MKKSFQILLVAMVATFLSGCGGYFQVADDWRGPEINLNIINGLQHQLTDVVINGVSLKEFYPDTTISIEKFERGDWDNVKLGWKMIRRSAHDWWGYNKKLRVYLQVVGYFRTNDGELIMLLPRGVRPGQTITATEERPCIIIFDKTSYRL